MNKRICMAILPLLCGTLAIAQQPKQDTGTAGTTKSSNTRNRQTAGCSMQATGTKDQSSEMQRSNTALRVIADTNLARSAITRQNQANAKSCIADALNAINSMPSTTSGHNANGTSANIVPIYTELGQVSVLGPVSKQQRSKQSGNMAATSNPGNTSSASHQGAANRTSTSTGQSANQADHGARRAPVGVTGVAQEFTSVTLDMNMAKEHLQAAQTAAQKGDMKAADAALAAVQDGVVLVSVEADRPLLKARENLMLARGSAQRGQYQNVRGPLTAAANALDSYASTGTQHANDARELSREIRSYAGNVKSQTAKNSDSVQKIDSWWDKARSWASPK